MNARTQALLSGIDGVLFDLDGLLLDTSGWDPSWTVAAKLAHFENSTACPGAARFVTELGKRGLPLAIGTSSDRHFFRAKSSRHPWFAHFRAVVCGDDEGVVRRKPAPDVYWQAARWLGVSPARCLVFEDSAAGIESARRARVARIVAVGHAARATRAIHSSFSSFQDLCGE